MALRAFRALLVFLSSPLAVLSLYGCCSLFTVWFPLSWGACTSGLWCLRHKLAAKLVQSRLPFVVSPPSDVSISPSPALAGLVIYSQSFGPTYCSCVLSSRGVSGAAFCRLGRVSRPLLLLFLAWVSSFDVCSDLGWKAEVLSWFLPSFGGGSPSLVLGFRLVVPTVRLSKLLEFSGTLCWGSFLLLTVFADSSGWLSDSPWLSALRGLAAAGVTLVFCPGHVGLP